MSDDIWVSTFGRLHKRLLKMASRLLRDDVEAQDVLQDAFCRLWINYRSVGSEREAEALSVTTVRNLSVSSLRSRKETTTVEDWLTAKEQETEVADNKAEREELFQMVEQLIEEHLSPLQRNILHLRELEGESTQEIARRLGMEETAVRMNLSRARRTIREIYNKER